MAKVFVDTWAWLTLLNRQDSRNHQAQIVMQQLQQNKSLLVTSEFILLKLADALSAPAIRQQTVGFVQTLRKNPLVEIVPLSSDLGEQAWRLFAARPDREWGLTDCTSFVIMTAQNIVQAFTADHHFVQAGFQIVH
ncbi:MAG: type II toxin-antitoxin system VapC family toxin [Anaerolineae bacterium]|nr:type II toxin-antitoxin system VapC family toxin [Anaerolineae bacterium]